MTTPRDLIAHANHCARRASGVTFGLFGLSYPDRMRILRELQLLDGELRLGDSELIKAAVHCAYERSLLFKGDGPDPLDQLEDAITRAGAE